MSSLGDLPGGTAYGEAHAVSADGSVVVGQSLSTGGQEAFRWTAGGMVGLGDLPGGTYYSEANGVSGDGTRVVGWSSATAGATPFLWTTTTLVMTPLGDLPGGTANGGAYAISANGEVVVGYSSSTNGNEPFRWTSSGGMVGLGDLPGGGFGGAAQAVSADGSVIVGQGMADGGNRAFAWDATHGMQSLTDLLLAAGVNLTGWTLTAATGVSADGTVIVGDGTHNGNMEGWIATLPNPTLVLKGKRKLTTNRTRVTVRGTATEARRVEFKVRGKPFKTAKGSPGKWRIPLRLRNGRNTIQIRADGLLRMTPPIKASIRLRG